MLENMATPSDEALYEKAKQEVDKVYDKPSAYRSMAYTRFYLKAYREKYGNDTNAYEGKRKNSPGELKKWRDEKWVDIRSFVETPKNPRACGSVSYKKDEYPLCMPIRKAKSYSEKQLITLLNRKAELGKTRLVKEPYLRDLGVTKSTPEKPEKEMKEKPEKKQALDLKPFKPEKSEKPETAVEDRMMEEKPKKKYYIKRPSKPVIPFRERASYQERLQKLKAEREIKSFQRLEEKVKAGKYKKTLVKTEEGDAIEYEPQKKSIQRRSQYVSQQPPKRATRASQADIINDPSLKLGEDVLRVDFN